MSILAAAAAVLTVAALAFLAVTGPVVRVRRRALAGVLLIALAAAGLRVGGAASPSALIVGAGLFVVGLTAIVVAARWPASAAAGFASPPATFSGIVHPRWLAVHAAAVLLVVVAPHLHILGLGVLVAILSGAMSVRHPGGGRPQIGQGAALLLFLGVWYALTLVGGEAPLRLSALDEAPYSEAFERTVALPLVFAAWPLLGLFPFHETRLGPLAAVAGGALIVRVAAEAVPIGLEHWQPLLYPLVLAAMIHALATRRDAEALAALAGLGLVSGSALVGWCAVGLCVGVSLLRAHQTLGAYGRKLNAEGEAIARGLAVAAALLTVPVLSGGLAAETVYTVLTAGCCAVYLWKR